MELKVKELMLYLKNRNLSVDTVKEKHELVRRIQAHENVHEPDIGLHTDTYNTQYRPQNFAQENVPEDTSNEPLEMPSHVTDPPPSDNAFVNFTPDVPVPTYSETQNAFSSANEFLASTSAASPSQSSSATASTAPNSQKGELLKLSEIESEDQIKDFSVRQLKFLLKDSLVDYKGMLEKSELRKRALNLYRDDKQNQDLVEDDKTNVPTSNNPSLQENFCKICWDNPVDCVFLECAHMVTCIGCSKAVRECPICRQNIVRTVRVFKS